MANGILIIDKSEGWTSHDVVAKLRGIFREKRIGHSGTLDPMATGVLPVFAGRATRAVEFASGENKEYLTGLRLGLVTDTQDVTGRVLEKRPVNLSVQELEKALAAFRGELLQTPPMYSALKRGGKKLYELAREGIEVERSPRPVTIYSLELEQQLSPTDFLLRAVCSKGTYIRTLCHDIGAALSCGGAMFSLRRTRAGVFGLDCAVTLEEVQAHPAPSSLLRPVDTLFAGYPAVLIGGRTLALAKNGNSFPWEGEDGLYRVYDPEGGFLLLGRLERGRMSTMKSFYEV